MTLVVRNEIDVVDAQVRYHLDHGVDFVIATDHNSVDGTTDVLRRYEREGQLHLIRETGDLRQGEWVTRMARLAATELGPDWLIHMDADGFWWPRYGSIPETLGAVPAQFGVVRGLVRHFVPRPDTGEPFFERMIARHPSLPSHQELYYSQVQIAHRAAPDVVVTNGNHDAYGTRLVLLREWWPLEILHFPVRSADQMRAKFYNHEQTVRPGPHVAGMVKAITHQGADNAFSSRVIDDDALRQRVADGTLAIDVRLRDALRHVYGTTALTSPDDFEPESPTAAERALLSDVGAFMETDSVVNLKRRLERLETSLTVVEPRHQRFARRPF